MVKEIPPNDSTDNEVGMVPYHPEELFWSDIDWPGGVHMLLSVQTKDLMQKISDEHPNVKHIQYYLKKTSHPYPHTSEERRKAFYIGALFIELCNFISDVEGIVQYMLANAAILIMMQTTDLIQEDFLKAFQTQDSDPESTDLWSLPGLDQLETQEQAQERYTNRKALYTEGSKHAVHHLHLYSLSADWKDKKDFKFHPFPETIEQQEIANRQYEILMELIIASRHQVRNFLISAAGRLLELGTITNWASEALYDAYLGALNRDRDQRMYGEDTHLPKNSRASYEEDDDNILPYGDI